MIELEGTASTELRNVSTVRRGAPIRRQIARAMQQQIEAGLIDYWLEDVVKERVIEERNDTNQVQKSAVWDYTPDVRVVVQRNTCLPICEYA